MICPHCLKSVDDDASFCPHCHSYLGSGASSHPEFVFCEGCGARLHPKDRTCPKCGRPAPGILSADSASSDLAAGRTASFPRLSHQMIESELPDLKYDAMTASRTVHEEVDPFATSVLDAGDIAAAERSGESRVAPAAASGDETGDPYHKPRRRWVRRLVACLFLVALVGGGVWFVREDPLGVMPTAVSRLKSSASQMFPSRQRAEAGSAGGAAASTAEQPQDEVLTDVQAYQRLVTLYETITAQHDALSQIVDDYNGGFIASDLNRRKSASEGAYAARDALDTAIDELKSLKLADGSAYSQEVQNLLELAGWVRSRVDIYCVSWDISLSFTGEDLPREHQSEILAPLRERAQEDEDAKMSFYAHVNEYKPQQPAA